MKEYAGKVLMLVENNFPKDNRVKNEAFTLVDAGYKVIVIALRQEGERFREDVDGIDVYRIPTLTLFKKLPNVNLSLFQKILQKMKSITGYVAEYSYFTSICILLTLYIHLKERIDVLHAHNPPDTLFLVGGLCKLLGRKYVFDHHDLSPELYLSRFGIKDSFIYRALIQVERLCLILADLVIATNQSYRDIEIDRANIRPEKIYIVRNGPDLKRVHLSTPDPTLTAMGKTILGYVGVMGPQDGVDYLLRALRCLRYELGRVDFFCVLIGTGDSLEDLKALAKQLKIEENVRFTGFIPDEEMLGCLSAIDICLDPDPSSPLNDVSTWIKIMEYMAMGKPIVSFDLKETRYTAGEAALYVPPNDESAFAKATSALMDDPSARQKMGSFGMMKIKQELAWQHISKNLLLAYDSIFKQHHSSSPRQTP